MGRLDSPSKLQNYSFTLLVSIDTKKVQIKKYFFTEPFLNAKAHTVETKVNQSI